MDEVINKKVKIMQVPAGTSKRHSDGLKHSEQKARAAHYRSFTEILLFPTEWRIKGVRGRRNLLLDQSIRLGDTMGARKQCL